MRDVFKHFKIGEIEYPFCFNINVVEKLQEEYGSITKWNECLQSEKGSEQIKALKCMMSESINEGIDMENIERNENRPFISLKETGRIISGLDDATLFAKTAIAESSGKPKNAQTE